MLIIKRVSLLLETIYQHGALWEGEHCLNPIRFDV